MVIKMKSAERHFENVTETRRKTMKRIGSKDTSIEVRLRKELWSRGIRYRKNFKKLPGSPDIAITKYKIAVFCDSEFWHGKDWDKLKSRLGDGNNPKYWVKKIAENIERDKRKDAELKDLGWTILHFWEKDINKDLETVCLLSNNHAKPKEYVEIGIDIDD